MKIRKPFIIGGLIVLITILIFLMGIQNGKKPIDYVALLFIIVGECLFFVMRGYFSIPSMLSSVAISSLSTIYLIINITFSLLFKNAFQDNISAFVIIHLVIICIFAVILFISQGIISNSNADEKRIITQKAVIDECERIANILVNNAKYEQHKSILNKIYEDIKYGDHISDYKSSEILSVLNNINNSDNESEIENLCNQAIQLIQDRNITVSQLKRGGF